LALAGCVKANSYCDIAAPIYYDLDTLDWLAKHDSLFLRDVISANEKWSVLCGS
jgi:hypothetical protein